MSIASLLGGTMGFWRPRQTPVPTPESRFPDVSKAPPDSRRLIRDRRYCHVLSCHQAVEFDKISEQFAWQALHHEMALVPGGEVSLVRETAVATPYRCELHCELQEVVPVESFYVDRRCVTNADFARFVQAGGYEDPQYWPENVLPNLLQFTDVTGQSGPRFWHRGQPPEDGLEHPVVGICWYEANAFATWSGKRLPTSEQWQRAGTWAGGKDSSGREMRYPWGNAFDPSRANVWASGIRATSPVDAFEKGDTPNGVSQLIGNVWEWVDAQFLPLADGGVSVSLDEPMGELRGGAFDTYFHSHATCQFRSGAPLLFRASNIGFRCCIPVDELPEIDASQAETDHNLSSDSDFSDLEPSQ